MSTTTSLPLVSEIPLSSGVMSTTTSLPLVSKIPLSSGVTTITHSIPSPTKNTTSSIVTAVPTATIETQMHSMPVLSEVSTYEIPSIGTPALKLFVPLSSVTSIHRSVGSSMQNIKAIPSKESALALVCSLASKKEPSNKMAPLPSVLPNLRDVKDTGSNPVSVTIDTSNLPVNDQETSISLLSVPSTCSELAGFIKVNENHKHIYVNQKNCISRPFAQYPVHLQNANVTHTDVGHVVIPVANKLDDNQIIIPLTSNAVYSQPIGISIPLGGSGVPVQVSCENMAHLDSTRKPVTQNSSSDVPVVAMTSNMIEMTRDSSCTATPSLSEIRVPANPTTSAPVTSLSISTSMSASMVITTHSTNTSLVEPTVTTYSIQSPAEILSQLSKAGVLPTMSSSQVSSVLSALGSDTCHLDLEADGTTHVELLTQQQVLHVPSSTDKVSALTQTDEHELMHGAEMNSTVECSSKVTHASSPTDEIVAGDSRLLDQILNHPSSCSSTDSTFLSSHVILSSKTGHLSHFPSADGNVEETNSGHCDTNCPTMPQSETCSKPSANLDVLVNQTEDQKNMKASNSKQIESANKGMSDEVAMPIKQENFVQKKTVKTIAPKKKILNCINERLNAKAKCSKPSNSNRTDVVSCYKCVCCPFLSLEKNIMATHVQIYHSSQELQKSVIAKCPGCENIFYSSKSLKVHLVQDHQVQDEELKAMVSLSIKSACKGASGKRGKLKTNVNESQILMPSGFKSLSVVNDDVPQLNIADKVIMNETSKIRVRNLNKDATPAATITDTLVQENAREEISSGTSEVEMRDGILVIDDDPLLHQKQTKLNAEENCEVEIIKTDAENAVQCSSELVLCEEVDVKRQQQQEESLKKKRGRPKGSKNVLTTVYKKMTSCLKPGERPLGYRCDIDGCAVRLRSHDNIEYHRRCHNKDKFCCPECSEEARHWNGLSTHLWRYHLIDMELYSCDQCDYKTNSFSKLMNLHHRIHGDDRPFLCDICGKGFKNPKQMRNHKAIHVAKLKQKLYPLGECDICGRTFTNPRMLRLHKDNVHGKLRPHLCNFCGYSASSRSTLKMHMRKHTGEKPFQCEQCNYQTSDHNSLRRHKMRHSGDKPYKCPHCSYACIQSSTYKAHLKTKHPGQETGLMFSCHICSFRSVRKDNYMAHMSDHDVSSNSSSKSKKYNGSKPRDSCSKTERTNEESKKAEKSSQAADLTTRENSVAERTVDESQLLKIPSDSVIHLVEDFVGSVNSQEESGNIQTLCVASIETVTQVPLTLDLEAEEITGDIQHIKEPEEHKYTVTEDITS